MFLKMRVNENTRRMVFEDTTSTAGVVGDSNVDGIIFYLPENSEYFEFQNAVVYVVFFDATNTSHKQVLDQIDDYSGMPKWTFDDNVLKNDATSQVPFFLHMVMSDTSGKVLKSWNTLPSAFIVYKNRDYNNQEEEAIRETDIDRLAGLVTTLTEKAKTIGDVEKVLASITGSSPEPVDTETKMIDDGHIYLYTGNETGFVTGALYYYIDGTLTYGGIYGSYDLDKTLTETGKAADAGAVGAAIDEVKEDLSAQERVVSKISNIPLLRNGTAPNGGNAYYVTTVLVQKISEQSNVITVYMDATINGASKYRWNLYTFAADAKGMTSINAISNATVIRRVSTIADTTDKYLDITFSSAEKYFAVDVTALNESESIIPLRIADVGNCLTIYEQFGTAYATIKANEVYSGIMTIGTTDAADTTLFKRGYINPATGEEQSVTNRLITDGYLPKNITTLNALNGYKYMILGYSDSVYLGSWNGSNFAKATSWRMQSTYKLSQFADYDIKIIVAAQNDATISATNAENIVFSYFGYHTDKTLTQSDVPADSKATGDAIAKAIADKRIYTSIAALVADTSLKSGEMCVTTGYYTNNDGGGGEYLIRARTSGESENGGTVHFTANGLAAELIANNKNTLNIKQWGAKSDGVTDISNAYSRCIEYIKANYPVTYINGDNGTGGGIVYFPAGEYYVGQTLEARHYVHIVGENEFTTIIKSDAGIVFYAHRDDYSGTDAVGRQNYFTLENLSFVNCKQVLYLVQCIGTKIINCQFIGCTRAISLYLTVKITIRNCLFRACTNGVFLGTVGNGPSTTVYIDKCWFRHCTASALLVDCDDGLCGIQPCAITDSIFEYNYRAVEILGSERYPTLAVFTRVFFEGNANAGIITNASVIAEMDNFFAPVGEGVEITPASYTKTNVQNFSDTLGFVVNSTP